MKKNIETPDWSYDGEYGPDRWHELYPVACSGERQSPVELGGASVAPLLKPLCLDYKGRSFKAVRDFYTLIIYPESETTDSLLIGGVEYLFNQIHFHTPAEHTVSEGLLPMEMHLVHITPAGAMAVVGVFIEEGAPNAELEALFCDIPADIAGERGAVSLEINKILPSGKGYYSYEGSLTMPPCTEGVKWIVLKDTITISVEGLRAYKAVFPPNTRSVCPLNGRRVVVTP